VISPAIEVKGLRIRISGKDILKGVDLRVPEATITAIMGPSGSGKTTFLKVLNRLIELVDGVEVSGEVRVYGSNIFDMDVYKVRRLFGMVFQTPNPFPHLSIYDNVAIGAKVIM